MNWNSNVGCNDPKVKEILTELISIGRRNRSGEKPIIENRQFANMFDDIDVTSGNMVFPITFLIDVSDSIKKYYEDLNNAIKQFMRQIVESESSLSSSVDFSIISFADVVKVRKPFSRITKGCIENPDYYVCPEEIKGMTNMASGLFIAWYLGEVRKKMYKDRGNKDHYFQPVIVLISDLKNTESTKIKGSCLIDDMISLYNKKIDGKKLGFIKFLVSNEDNGYSREYNELLKGQVVDSAERFAQSLDTLSRELHATMAQLAEQPRIVPDTYDKGAVVMSTSDEDVFLSENSRNELMSKKRELNENDVLIRNTFHKADTD